MQIPFSLHAGFSAPVQGDPNITKCRFFFKFEPMIRPAALAPPAPEDRPSGACRTSGFPSQTEQGAPTVAGNP
jgi:hypothetical protein